MVYLGGPKAFVGLKVIHAAALRQGVLKTSAPSFGVHVRPPYRCLGFIQPKDIQREMGALPYGEVATPVSLVGAIIDRPPQSALVNVPAISVGSDALVAPPRTAYTYRYGGLRASRPTGVLDLYFTSLHAWFR